MVKQYIKNQEFYKDKVQDWDLFNVELLSTNFLVDRKGVFYVEGSTFFVCDNNFNILPLKQEYLKTWREDRYSINETSTQDVEYDFGFSNENKDVFLKIDLVHQQLILTILNCEGMKLFLKNSFYDITNDSFRVVL